MRHTVVYRTMLFCGLAAVALTNSCTVRPKNAGISKLEEVRIAAEKAEEKLAELREERIALEKALEQKQQELRSLEKERDELRSRIENQSSQGSSDK